MDSDRVRGLFGRLRAPTKQPCVLPRSTCSGGRVVTRSVGICVLVIACGGQEITNNDGSTDVSLTGDDTNALDASREFPRRDHDAEPFADHALPILGEYRPPSGIPCTENGGCGKRVSCDPYSGWCCDGFALDDVTGECVCGYGLGCSSDRNTHCCLPSGQSAYSCVVTDSGNCPLIDP